eukprot:SAG31_NODE_11943_length_983_cov_1.095023_2_plen_116_part_01
MRTVPLSIRDRELLDSARSQSERWRAGAQRATNLLADQYTRYGREIAKPSFTAWRYVAAARTVLARAGRSGGGTLGGLCARQRLAFSSLLLDYADAANALPCEVVMLACSPIGGPC